VFEANILASGSSRRRTWVEAKWHLPRDPSNQGRLSLANLLSVPVLCLDGKARNFPAQRP